MNSAGAKLRSLIRIRWAAIVGQLLVFVIAWSWIATDLVVLPFLAILGGVFVSNLAAKFLLRNDRISSPELIAAILIFDILALTAILYFYGGYTNPFSMFYLVHITLCAIFLGTFWTWFSFVLSSLLFIGLFFWHIPIQDLSHQMSSMGHSHHHVEAGAPFDLHLHGMLVAFILIGFLLSVFITRITQELEKLKELDAKRSKMQALANVAAGAAHEIATPLATISLIVEGLRGENRKDGKIADVHEELEELASEVERADDILSSIRSVSPELQGETVSSFLVTALLSDVRRRLSSEYNAALFIADFDRNLEVSSLRASLVQAIVSLVRNGIEAGGSSPKVDLSIGLVGDKLLISVQDNGGGVAVEKLERLGEPFFTTKDPGKGMGLGLYLVHSFVSYVDGELSFENKAGGLLVKLIIPNNDR